MVFAAELLKDVTTAESLQDLFSIHHVLFYVPHPSVYIFHPSVYILHDLFLRFLFDAVTALIFVDFALILFYFHPLFLQLLYSFLLPQFLIEHFLPIIVYFLL